MTDGELGDLTAAGSLAHGIEKCIDRQIGACRTALESGEYCIDHFVKCQALFEMQLRSETDLGIHDVVGGEVLSALEGNALDGVALLHHGAGVSERLEVEHQVVALGALVEPFAELGNVSGRQPVVAVFLRQLDHRRRTQPAIKVVVQQHLRGPGNQISRRHPPTLPTPT